MPGDIQEGSPWLMYWLGVCKLFEEPAAGMACFEKAYELFRVEDDPIGLLLSWCGIIEGTVIAWSNLTSLDRWIDEMEALRKKFPRHPSAQVENRVVTDMFMALCLHQPSHPDLPAWEERLWNSMRDCRDINALLFMAHWLIFYHTLTGNMAKATLVLRHLQGLARHAVINPLDFILSKVIEAYYFSFSGSFDECQRAVAAGLRTADESGVHVWDFSLHSVGAYGNLAMGDLATARRSLQDMAERTNRSRAGDVSHFHYLLSWEAMLKGNPQQAQMHGTVFMDITSQFMATPFFHGLNSIAFALVLIAQGDYAGAKSHLENASLIAEETQSELIAYKDHLARAHLAFEQEIWHEGIEQLAQALSIGQTNQIYSSDWWLPQVMNRLCLVALEEGIEIPYVQELIRRHRMPPEEPALHIEHWPWPLKIYTLGRFEIEKDGKPMLFSGKVQKKPIEMLKALVALGERGAAQEQLSDALWPDAEGDAAHSSFKMTLSRLRKLLGSDKAIRLQEGKAALDPSCCWVDAWAFERMSGNTEAAIKEKEAEDSGITGKKANTLGITEKTLALYRGHFLSQDEALVWAVSMRERLRDRFLRLITCAGEYLEHTGQWQKAADYYQRALDTDDLSEPLYQRLIVCYANLGERAELMKAYSRCRSVLSAVLGIEPSLQTEAIKEEALKR